MKTIIECLLDSKEKTFRYPHRYTKMGGGGGVNIGPPRANFKKLVDKNAKKPN